MNEKLVKICQRRQAHRRRADRHITADQRVEHPPGDHDDLSGVQFDEGDLIRPPALSQVLDHLAAEQWMPGVVNGDIPPDMGRMTLSVPRRLRRPVPRQLGWPPGLTGGRA
jgi:hypothetical protein